MASRELERLCRYLRYSQLAHAFSEQFPRFETDIDSLVAERVGGKLRYFVDCVAAK